MVGDKEVNIRNKLTRGELTAALLLQCLDSIMKNNLEFTEKRNAITVILRQDSCLILTYVRFLAVGDYVVSKKFSYKEPFRTWLTGLAVTLATIICYFAFWRLSPGTTFLVGCVALVSLIALSWRYGKAERKRQEMATKPPQQNAHGA